jgi:tRNA A37 threonylcarbamoyladenosine dehydratase
MPKATCLVKHFKNIVPQAKVEPIIELFSIKNADRLLAGNPDFVLGNVGNQPGVASCGDSNVSLLN